MSFSLSRDPSRLDLERIHRWLAGSYWSPGIRREVVERAFANSFVVGAYAEDGQQLGVVRVVTDQATFAWICDVFVDDGARGRGLAKAMVAEAMADPRLTTLRRWCLRTKDAHEVYRPLGFQTVQDHHWMEILPPPSRWSE